MVTFFLTNAVPSFGSSSLSPLEYPSPIKAMPSSALTPCPNPKGVISFDPRAISRALAETSVFAIKGKSVTRVALDPSAWPYLTNRTWGRTNPPTPNFPKQRIAKGTPSQPGATIVASSCGEGLLKKTEVIDVALVTASGTRAHCNDCVAHFYFIDRRGHSLLYEIF